jgi:hypothetical protein
MINNKITGTLAIICNLIAFLYKGMLGGRAGWEVMTLLVLIGLVLTIITFSKKRNAISWISIGTAVLSLVAFLFG